MTDPMNTSKIQKRIIITPNIKVAQRSVWMLRKRRKIGKRKIYERWRWWFARFHDLLEKQTDGKYKKMKKKVSPCEKDG
jgi:hypothetical protein